jgi:aspartyl-tRNA(Asn)/glutamyl-tRNA(Gln) amidotransferase subunit B
MTFEPVVGLEIHAELQTQTKMFCGCRRVDTTQAAPNSAVCPICLGYPGTLPVVNERAVELALRVALALGCEVLPESIFARKNYFYPDLPKGYQISQYETPLASGGALRIVTPAGSRVVRLRRVHLEEDTGKLTHAEGQPPASLVDFNRAGVPLIEIVSEPDLFSVEEVKAYTTAMRRLLRYLEVNSGDMEKGVIRFEANVSIRPAGSHELGTRVEIKNLNSFRSLVRAIDFEVLRQSELLVRGERVIQETLGWDESRGETTSQRSKEEAHDYRYFPEPDLPPLRIEADGLARVRAALPELPDARRERLMAEYQLGAAEAEVIVEDRATADFFEASAHARPALAPRRLAAWLTSDLFGTLNALGRPLVDAHGQPALAPADFADLVERVVTGGITGASGKAVLEEMLRGGRTPEAIVRERGLERIGDASALRDIVERVVRENAAQADQVRAGKLSVVQWLVGQVMKASRGRADPRLVQAMLEEYLSSGRDG